MKSKLFSLILLCLITLSIKAQQVNPKDQPVPVTLKVSDWEAIISILHNAPVVGNVRDPLIQNITNQAQYYLQALVKQDSSMQKAVDSARKNKKDVTVNKPGSTGVEHAETVNIGTDPAPKTKPKKRSK